MLSLSATKLIFRGNTNTFSYPVE